MLTCQDLFSRDQDKTKTSTFRQVYFKTVLQPSTTVIEYENIFQSYSYGSTLTVVKLSNLYLHRYQSIWKQTYNRL